MTPFNVYDFKITISKFFLCTEREYIETLIHEMIHVLMAVKGEFRKDKRVHGPLFRKYMEEINKNFPEYSITVKEQRQLPVNKTRMAMQNGFLLIFDNKVYFNLYKDRIDKNRHGGILRKLVFHYGIQRGEIYFFQGKYTTLATAPVRQNLKTLTGKIQFLHNEKEMIKLRNNIRENHLYYYSIKSNYSFIDKLLQR